MRRQWFVPAAVALMVGGATVVASAAPTAAAVSSSNSVQGKQISIHKVGTAQLTTSGTGSGELRPPGDDDLGPANPNSNRHHYRGPATGVTPTQVLDVTRHESGYQGVNHFDQRAADSGNQYSLVPPDQALCAGDGQVFEAVNDAVRVYTTAGAPASGVVSINQFYWHDHQIDRTTNVASPHQMGDPSCVFDAGSNRFYFTVYDLLSDSGANSLGPSAVDIAVSPVGTALGQWSVYQLNTTNDGTNGTPSRPNCPCFGDYPHLGTDANGLYITTNEYETLGDGYNGAVVYAVDKQALGAGTATIPGALFDTQGADVYQGMTYDGFTLAPALSAGTAYAPNTMYFLSSDAYAGDNPIKSSQILIWKITNTSAIHSNPASLHLEHAPVAVNVYTPPPASDQKDGTTPLADCLNKDACATTVLGAPDPYHETEFAFDSSDSRMLQSAYADGKVWGALDTAVDVKHNTKAGVAYYVVDPSSNSIAKQGTLAVANNNISYPALGVTSTGKAVMAITLVGKDYFPSAAYVRLTDKRGNQVSDVQVVGAGKGPDDDFSGYQGFEYNVPRWGDYGAASVVGTKVWIASEYIAQTCTLKQFKADPFGTCGNTRTALANWSTHIASVDLG